MDKIKTVHQCLFCPQTFDSASDKDDHILDHFAQETCTDCNQHLIRIGKYLYTRHNEATCMKKVPTSKEHGELCTPIEPIAMIAEKNTLQYEESDVAAVSLDLDTSELRTPIKIEPLDENPLRDTFDFEPTLCSSREIVNIVDIQKRFPNIDLNPVVVLEDIRKKTDKSRPPNSKRWRIDYLINDLVEDIKVEEETQDSCKQLDENEQTVGCEAESEERVELHQLNNRLSKFIDHPKIPQLFECFICHKNLKNSFTVVRHLKMVHDENGKKYKCKKCNKSYFYYNQHQNHMNTVHPNNPRFVCSTCKKVCTSKTTLRIHGYIHTGEKPYKCKYEGCEKMFRTPEKRNRHFKIHVYATKNSHRVKDSNRRSKQVHNVTERQVHNVPANTPNHSTINTQFILPSNGKSVKSTRDPLSTPDDENDVPNNGDSEQVCEFIKVEELSIESDSNLNLQEEEEEEQVDALVPTGKRDIEQHKCDDCGEIFRWKSTLESHVSRVHTGTGKFNCAICKKKFAQLRYRDDHIKSVHGPKKHKCELCKSLFARRFDLKRHLDVVHLNIANYKCNTCEMIFKHKQSLSIHQRIHTEERPYRCAYDGCNKSYRTHFLKVRHERTHTNERPYACTIEGCEKNFGTSQRLKVHREGVHGITTLV